MPAVDDQSVTAHPTAKWIACQITDAFPWDEAPNYMIRDRDGGRMFHGLFHVEHWRNPVARMHLKYRCDRDFLVSSKAARGRTESTGLHASILLSPARLAT